MNLINLLALISVACFAISLIGLMVMLRRQEKRRSKQAELTKKLKLASIECQLQHQQIKHLQKQQHK